MSNNSSSSDGGLQAGQGVGRRVPRAVHVDQAVVGGRVVRVEVVGTQGGCRIGQRGRRVRPARGQGDRLAGRAREGPGVRQGAVDLLQRPLYRRPHAVHPVGHRDECQHAYDGHHHQQLDQGIAAATPGRGDHGKPRGRYSGWLSGVPEELKTYFNYFFTYLNFSHDSQSSIS